MPGLCGSVESFLRMFSGTGMPQLTYNRPERRGKASFPSKVGRAIPCAPPDFKAQQEKAETTGKVLCSLCFLLFTCPSLQAPGVGGCFPGASHRKTQPGCN